MEQLSSPHLSSTGGASPRAVLGRNLLQQAVRSPTTTTATAAAAPRPLLPATRNLLQLAGRSPATTCAADQQPRQLHPPASSSSSAASIGALARNLLQQAGRSPAPATPAAPCPQPSAPASIGAGGRNLVQQAVRSPAPPTTPTAAPRPQPSALRGARNMAAGASALTPALPSSTSLTTQSKPAKWTGKSTRGGKRIPMAKRRAIAAAKAHGDSWEDITKAGGGCSKKSAAMWAKRVENGEGVRDKPKCRPPKWPISKAVIEITKHLPPLVYTNKDLNQAAKDAGIPASTFHHLRPEVKKRLTLAVPDYWFDSNGKQKIVAHIKNPELKEIKIGMFVVSEPEILNALIEALKRGVRVLLLLDFDNAKAYSIGIGKLIKAGAQICHCIHPFHWKVAIFDGEILVIGSQNWSGHGTDGPNYECAVVLTGPIVAIFEEEFDRLWKIANTKDSNKQARTTETDGVERREKSALELTSASEQGGSQKRKKSMGRPRIRTLFQTTLASLGLDSNLQPVVGTRVQGK